MQLHKHRQYKEAQIHKDGELCMQIRHNYNTYMHKDAQIHKNESKKRNANMPEVVKKCANFVHGGCDFLFWGVDFMCATF